MRAPFRVRNDAPMCAVFGCVWVGVILHAGFLRKVEVTVLTSQGKSESMWTDCQWGSWVQILPWAPTSGFGIGVVHQPSKLTR